MKHLMVVTALLFMAACQAPAEKGCADCEKMARDAKAKHEMMKHKDGGCCCCKKMQCNKPH